ncbi:hypothetical protein EV421DRAFT_1999586 [Armillaria borealis]|uniref:Uncharacterized protein n=1 Tax=Armillaria borealis TaxID=47425 RepID=A0AA39MWD4_9AGAR|nr:hypothetical protein EV421DRAFT_1999586 [Armillaria borealis]
MLLMENLGPGNQDMRDAFTSSRLLLSHESSLVIYRTPKMVPAPGWGANTWRQPSNALCDSQPSMGDSTPTILAACRSDSSGLRTPHATHVIAATPLGFTYPLPPGRTPSDPTQYPLAPSASGRSGSRASSYSSSSSPSLGRSGSHSNRNRRNAADTPVVPSPNLLPPSVNLIGGAAVPPEESPSELTTYMDTHANSVTMTPHMGMGRGVVTNGWRSIAIYGPVFPLSCLGTTVSWSAY